MTQPVGSDKPKSNDIPDVDWDAIASKVRAPKSTAVQTGELPLRSYILLLAASAAANDSLRQKSKSLLNAQCRRWEPDWLKDIAFYAANKGLSIEDAIVELVNNDQ
ncbi:MAG: hypothetical protein AAFO04_28930 [Cyanobacteria bacterium J06592_8]